MKRIFAGVAVVGLAMGGALVAKGAKDDASTIDAVVGSMTAEQLNGPEQPSTVNGPKELTSQQVADILEELKDIPANGGIVKIAHRHQASPAQVRLILRKKQDRLQELAPAQVEVP